MFVLGLLPRPLDDARQVELLKLQNQSLFMVTRNLQRKMVPVSYVPAYKLFLKWVKNPDNSFDIETDNIYYEQGSNGISPNGQVHLHLLLVKMLGLEQIHYEWQGMPVVRRQSGRRVMEDRTLGVKDQKRMPKQLKKGHGNRICGAEKEGVSGRGDHLDGSAGSPPELVGM